MENVPRGTFSIGPFNHSHNPPQYSHIVGYTFHFYAHIGGAQGLSSAYEQAYVGSGGISCGRLKKYTAPPALDTQMREAVWHL